MNILKVHLKELPSKVNKGNASLAYKLTYFLKLFIDFIVIAGENTQF